MENFESVLNRYWLNSLQPIAFSNACSVSDFFYTTIETPLTVRYKEHVTHSFFWYAIAMVVWFKSSYSDSNDLFACALHTLAPFPLPASLQFSTVYVGLMLYEIWIWQQSNYECCRAVFKMSTPAFIAKQVVTCLHCIAGHVTSVGIVTAYVTHGITARYWCNSRKTHWLIGLCFILWFLWHDL